MAISDGMLMGTGLTAFSTFEPYSLIESVKYVAGAGLLMYAIELILKESPKRQMASISNDDK